MKVAMHIRAIHLNMIKFGTVSISKSTYLEFSAMPSITTVLLFTDKYN